MLHGTLEAVWEPHGPPLTFPKLGLPGSPLDMFTIATPVSPVTGLEPESAETLGWGGGDQEEV